MAKRRYSKKGNKIEPAVQTLTFATGTPGAGVTETNYIDLSQAASLANRRFYRQGINWAVASIKVFSLQPGLVVVSKLPNIWVMSNAWEKGFRAWNRMNKEALEEQPSIRPKFLDFKIYADSTHHAAGFPSNMIPQSLSGVATTPGEWTPSKVVHPVAAGATEGATIESEIIAVGGSYPGVSAVTGFNAVSLIEGYAASRGLPDVLDPNVPADSADVNNATPENWIGAMFNDGTEQMDDVLTDMITENNIAPYPFENDGVHVDTMYPGGANQMASLEWHDVVQIYSSSGVPGQGVGTQMLKGGNFPCGLIKIDWTPDETNANVVIQVNLVPGNHRGYLCEPMTEM